MTPKGTAGEWVEEKYAQLVSEGGDNDMPLNVNTHGGLLSFGAPWEVPAAFNIIEGVQQITGRAENRQVSGARRALVYGNGGIFSASAVALLQRPV